MEKSSIQWCDDTINPTMGCDGCELWTARRRSCYAGILHERRGGKNPGYARSFDVVERFPGRVERAARKTSLEGLKRLEKRWLDGSPRLIFVSDMSDALSDGVSFEYLEAEIINTALSPNGMRHRWLWLTKRPGRMASFSKWLREHDVPWPGNIWVGTSITAAANYGRIRDLLSVGDEHTLRFLSVEPQSAPLDVTTWLPELDWIIQGGESGDSAKPFEVEWAEDLLDASKKNGVPYFLKQLGKTALSRGKPMKLGDSHGGDWAEWPRGLRVRQVPTVGTSKIRPEILRKARAE